MSIAALETEKDKEMSQLLHEEIGVLKTQKEELEQRLKVLLLPVDPNDEKKRHSGDKGRGRAATKPRCLPRK